ncbi:hypothetical protein H6F89_00110 [Cyanobacteria bacterium FACHB-63]|nr:hypothetical protein [Cyanobacteria bacterium FACHB-63]
MIDLAQVPDHPRRAATYASFKLLQNGRIRYYDNYKPAKISGKTAGACLVVEVDAITGNVLRTWYESYDHQHRVIRIHPKRPIDLGHIEIDPATGKEITRW